MKSVELRDFLNFSFLSDVKLSPDNKFAAYLRHRCNAKKDGYDTQLRINDLAGGDRTVDFEGNVKLYCWDGCGNVILFGVKKDETTVFYRADMASGEVVQAFVIDHNVSSIEFISSGLYLVSARVNIKDDAGDSDCIIIDELPAQFNGAGYTSGTRVTLFVYSEKRNELDKILADKLDVSLFTLSPEKNKVVVTGHEYDDVGIIKGGIYLYDLETGAGRTLIEKGMYRISWAAMMDDKIVFAGTLGKHNSIMENQYFYILDTESMVVEEYSKPDLYVMGLSIGSDCRYGSGKLCTLSCSKIYFSSAKAGSCHMFEIDEKGSLRQITKSEGSVDFLDVKGSEAVFIGLRIMKLQELYKIDLKTGEEVQLTYFNESYMDNRSIVQPVPAFFTNKDGVEISGWVLKPVGFDETKKYPAILDIHGGPKASYGTVYYHEMQLWANRGYFVFFCNPRGSDGSGDEFSRIMGKNGTVDYDDIMEFTDHVLSSYPSVDRLKVGVTGGSYGGYMTNWILGHTNRFAAAATQRSIGDWIVHEYAADTGYWVTSQAYPPNSINQVYKAWEQSPGKYAVNIKTPVLFIHSDQDLRCPLCEAMAVYSGAMRSGAEMRMCLFHGENHELSRSGKPSNRIKRLEEITAWMDKYLKKEDR